MGSEPGSVGQYLLNNRAELEAAKIRLGAVETQGASNLAELATHQSVLDALQAAVSSLQTLAVTEDRFMELIYSVDVFGVEQVIGLAVVNLKNNKVVNVQPYVSDAIMKTGFDSAQANDNVTTFPITQYSPTLYNSYFWNGRAPNYLTGVAPNGEIVELKVSVTNIVTTPDASGKYPLTLEIKEGYTWSNGDPLVAEDIAVVFDILALYDTTSAGGLAIPLAVDSISVSESNPRQFTLDLNVYPGDYAVLDVITGLQVMPHQFYSGHLATVAEFEARNLVITQPQLGDLLVTQLAAKESTNPVKLVRTNQLTAKDVTSLTFGATAGFSISGAYPQNPNARLELSKPISGEQYSTVTGSYFKQYWNVGVTDVIGQETAADSAWTNLDSGDISAWTQAITAPPQAVLDNTNISLDSSIGLGFFGCFLQDQYYKVNSDNTISTTKALMGCLDWRTAVKALINTAEVVDTLNTADSSQEYYDTASLLPTGTVDSLSIVNTGIGVADTETAKTNALAIFAAGSDGIAKNTTTNEWEINGVAIGPIAMVTVSGREAMFTRAVTLLQELGFDIELVTVAFSFVSGWLQPTSAQIAQGFYNYTAFGADVNKAQDSNGVFREVAGLGVGLPANMDPRSLLRFFTPEKPFWNLPDYNAIFDELMAATEQSVIDQKLQELQTYLLITDVIVIPVYQKESKFYYRNDVLEVKRNGYTLGPPGNFLRPAPALRSIDNLLGNI